MKISETVIEGVRRTLYDLAYLDLTSEQVEEIVESFPESLVKSIQECDETDEDIGKAILNQLSLLLTERDWPHHARSDSYRDAWDLQMRTCFHNRGYKLRDER
jgi:hypothetical protein